MEKNTIYNYPTDSKNQCIPEKTFTDKISEIQTHTLLPSFSKAKKGCEFESHWQCIIYCCF